MDKALIVSELKLTPYVLYPYKSVACIEKMFFLKIC